MRPLARKHDTTAQVRPGATIEVLGRFEENQNKQETQKTQEVRGKRYGKCLNMNRKLFAKKIKLDMEAGIARTLAQMGELHERCSRVEPKGAVEGVCGGAEDAPWMQCGCCNMGMLCGSWTLGRTVGAGWK